MVTPVSSLCMLLLLKLVVATTCDSYGGPSIYEYDIEKAVTYRDNPNNLAAGWRQYEDRLIYKGNFTVPRGTTTNTDKAAFRFPSAGIHPRWNITNVISLDISGSRSTGAVAYLLRGGIGFTHVSIGYTYRPYYGVLHQVEIYGR